MTTLFAPDEYRILSEAGIPSSCVSKYSNGHIVPHKSRRAAIIELLGRDPFDGNQAKPPGRPKILQPAPVIASGNCQPAVNNCQLDILPPHRHIEINPCIDGEVCLAVRNAAMRPVANKLLDQKRDTPCTNCKRGIERARAEAAKKTAHVGVLVCDCGEEKTRDAKNRHACASERKRSFRPQPCRGGRGATL